MKKLAVLLMGAVLWSGHPRLARAEDRAVEEIVVTAQKREQTLEEVPISITALSGEFMTEAGISGIHDLARYTPNVFYGEASPCCNTVFIRGLGSAVSAGAFDPSVGLVLDELSIPKDIYLADPIFDIERFEVLRGPQGTLFGQNTPAGLFNVTTAKPTREFSGYVLGRIGDVDVHRFEAALGGPLGPFGDVAQFRLAILDGQQPEDVLNTKRDEKEPATEQQGARLRLAFQPLDDLEVLLTAARSHIAGARTFSWQQADLSDGSVEFLRQYDPEFEDDGLNHQDSMDFPSPIERWTDQVQGNGRYSLGSIGPVRDAEIVTVVGSTGFRNDPVEADADFSPAAILHVSNPMKYDQVSGEIRFGGLVPGPFLGEIDFLVGFLGFESSFENATSAIAGPDFEDFLASPAGFEFAAGAPPPDGIPGLAATFASLGLDPGSIPPVLEGDGFLVASDQSTSAQAVFGQAVWRFTDEWALTLGARMTFEEKTAVIDFDCFDPGIVCAALGAQPFVLDVDRRESDFSPKVTVQYFPFESLALFAGRSTGFKSGGFNNYPTSSQGVEVDTETTVSWEAGAKGTLFDRSLSYGATFFHMDVDDLQVQQFLGGTTVLVQNAASARSRGVEADFQWLTPWAPLGIRGAGSFTDARYKDYPNAPAPRSFASPEQDLSGERMPYVSEWQLNVTPELRFPLPGRFLGSDLAMSLSVDVIYKSDYFLDVDLDPETRQDDSVLMNGRVRVSALDEALSLGVGVHNLTDADILQFKTDSSLFPGYMDVQEFQRVVYVEARYAW